MNALPASADVVVIGGGIAGASDAFFLARAGLSVVVVERGEQLAGLTTAQSVACFRAQWDEPDYAALVHPSIDFYGSFAERVGLPGWDIGLHRNGWLFVTGADDGPSVVAGFRCRSPSTRRRGLGGARWRRGSQALRVPRPGCHGGLISRGGRLGVAVRGDLRLREGEWRHVRDANPGDVGSERRRRL